MIRPALPGDSWQILPKVRECERIELLALGHTPAECMLYGSMNSDAVTVEIGGKPCGMAGIVDHGDHGVPWAVFTTDIERNPLTFLRASRRWIDANTHPYLINYVDIRNGKTILWLRWLGFTIEDAVPYGKNGELFHPFWMVKCVTRH